MYKMAKVNHNIAFHTQKRHFVHKNEQNIMIMYKLSPA